MWIAPHLPFQGTAPGPGTLKVNFEQERNDEPEKKTSAHFRQTWQGWQGMAEDAAAASAAAGYDAAALAEAAASMGSPGTSGETEQTAAAAVDDAAEVAGADRRAGSVEAGDLVAEEQKKAEEGGSMGVSLPEGWVSLPLNDRLMHHPAVPVSLQ